MINKRWLEGSGGVAAIFAGFLWLASAWFGREDAPRIAADYSPDVPKERARLEHVRTAGGLNFYAAIAAAVAAISQGVALLLPSARACHMRVDKADLPSKLADQTWTPCTVDEVTVAWLKSEWDNWPHVSLTWDRRLLDDPLPIDNASIELRARMLRNIRSPILDQLPLDQMKWYRVEHLRKTHLAELRALNHAAWNSEADRNEIELVAKRKTQPEFKWRRTAGPNPDWSPILFGHDRSGPFTIIEGNHRMTAVAQPDFDFSFPLTAYMGISPRACVWHAPDLR